MRTNAKHSDRLNIFLEKLESKGIRQALVSDPKSVTYLTGFSTVGPRSVTFLLACCDEPSKMILGKSEYSEKVLKFNGNILTFDDYNMAKRMIAYPDYVAKIMDKLLKNNEIHLRGKTGIETWHLPAIYTNHLLKERSTGSSVVDVSSLIIKLRQIKGSDEITNISHAVNLLDRSYNEVRETVRSGMTERELFSAFNAVIQDYRTRNTDLISPLRGGIVSGSRALAIGGPPTLKRISSNETLIADLQLSFNQYWADMARTFLLADKKNIKQRQIHSTIMDAMTKAEQMLRPGTRAKDIFTIVSDTIVKAGFNHLPHHAGHGLGLDDQEAPFFLPNSNERLEKNMFIALEPGIYDSHSGYGIRIENNYLITDNKPKLISRASTDLI